MLILLIVRLTTKYEVLKINTVQLQLIIMDYQHNLYLQK